MESGLRHMSLGRYFCCWCSIVMLLLFSGCGQPEVANEGANAETESVKTETPVLSSTVEPPYVIAADDFSNLQLENVAMPVYDKFTLAERRASGLPTNLPELQPPEEKVAYLTFDDGPDTENTPAILDILAAEQVKATFYVLGRNVAAYPEITERIFAEGHAIGNHSYDHNYDVLYASAENYLKEMEDTDEAIHNIIGVRPLVTRAPSGSLGNFTPAYRKAIAENGYVEHDWNVSSADTAPNNPVAQDFIDNITGEATMDSAIVLMHCSSGHAETVKALPSIIDVLREKGYSFGVVTPMTPQPW